MKSSELIKKLAEDMTSWLNSPQLEGVIMNEVTLEGFILRWMLDNDTTIM
jgi:hypothetical protein